MLALILFWLILSLTSVIFFSMCGVPNKGTILCQYLKSGPSSVVSNFPNDTIKQASNQPINQAYKHYSDMISISALK